MKTLALDLIATIAVHEYSFWLALILLVCLILHVSKLQAQALKGGGE